jgi:hypothetical protein
MRTKRDPETDEHRKVRTAKETQQRDARVSAENRALDAAVARSIQLYGA